MFNKSVSFSPSPFITPITGPILPVIVLIALLLLIRHRGRNRVEERAWRMGRLWDKKLLILDLKEGKERKISLVKRINV